MSDYIRSIRALVGHAKIFTPSTACIITNSSGAILLQHRSSQNNWGCPGGLMDLGETVIECLEREIKEETNLEIYDVQLFGIYSGPEFEGKYPNGDEIASVLMVFTARTETENFEINEESNALEFFHPTKMPAHINSHHEPYLKDYGMWLEGKINRPVVL